MTGTFHVYKWALEWCQDSRLRSLFKISDLFVSPLDWGYLTQPLTESNLPNEQTEHILFQGLLVVQ